MLSNLYARSVLTLLLLSLLPPSNNTVTITNHNTSYKVLQSYLQYQTAVVRKDFATANALLPSIPVTEYTAVARFLESQGFKEEALAVSRDPDHRCVRTTSTITTATISLLLLVVLLVQLDCLYCYCCQSESHTATSS
jgi:Coatomer WD associated region